MHITVLGSRPLAISSNNDYITNAAGFKGKSIKEDYMIYQ